MEALLDRFTAAHRGLAEPTELNATHLINVSIVTVTAFAIIGLFDFCVARRFKKTYFALHVFANIVITAYTFGGVLDSLANPTSSTLPGPTGAVSQIYLAWTYAIHIYHPIFFKTGTMDWVHHIPVYTLNTLMFSVLSGPAFQLQACILTGIPGGVDYFLQVLEGEGLLSRALYKELGSWINTHIRAPLGWLSGYICLVGLYRASQAGEASSWQTIVFFLLGLHACWNAPFFCRQAVEANILDTVNRFRLVGGELKLPKVRALSGKAVDSKGGDKSPLM